MRLSRKPLIGATLAAMLVALGVGSETLERSAAAGQSMAPRFEVDPFWPKPLPNHWIIGSAVGVGVDSRDHVFIVHRQASLNERTEAGASTDPPTGECCLPAPPVLEFDPDGNLVGYWGGEGEGYDWPSSNHGITIDPNDNVWIGGNGSGDSQLLKFTHDGRLLNQFGAAGLEPDSHSTDHFGRVAKISFDAAGDEAYVSDGYDHRRVAVIDAETGELQRYWGAYGNRPDDSELGPYDPDAPPSWQFRTPVHCAEPSEDGLVYVCDRPNDRIQVFRTDGTFVKEVRIAPRTLGDGSTWDIAFSRDPEQTYIYLADGKNMKVYILERESLEVLTSFGDGGRQPGQFFAVHSIATDSQGNIFTTETYEGKRVQKFVFQGIGPVDKANQGPPWPQEEQ